MICVRANALTPVRGSGLDKISDMPNPETPVRRVVHCLSVRRSRDLERYKLVLYRISLMRSY